MATLVEFLSGEQLTLRLVKAQEKRKLAMADERGRASSLSPDKVLFQHTAGSIEELERRLAALTAEVDVPLLWEMLAEEGAGEAREAGPLARLYFGEESDAHASALFRAASADGLHFRRRGKTFEPRSAEEIARIRQQRAAEDQAARELQQLTVALTEGDPPDDALARRLDQHIRGGPDRLLARALESAFSDPLRGAFDLLMRGGRLPATASFEVMQADLKQELPAAVVEHAASLAPAPASGRVLRAAFSIDDAETREVDDVLSLCQEGHLTRVDIDIADPGTLVRRGDPADQEAMRRAATVYLPTGIYYMLPERLGCQLLSLQAGEPRPALRTSVWLDSEGNVEGSELSRVVIRVGQRLDYCTADQLLQAGTDPTAELLRRLDALAGALRRQRRASGALFMTRREWKIKVTDEGRQITATPIDPGSPSRQLVAEMMILTNRLAAQEAAERELPIIYRVQPPPVETPPPEWLDSTDPAIFEKLRRSIQPASLSLTPAPHWGLGLEAYTQVSSPLRRFADLCVQRQLTSSLEGAPPAYSADELLRVLANAEATEKEVRRIEAAVTEQWSLEYVRRLPEQRSLEAMILGEHPAGGHRVELQCCGARGVLVDDRRHEPGTLLAVDVTRVKPRKGVLRLAPSA